MSSRTALNARALGSVHPANAGRPDGVTRAQAIAADGCGITAVVRAPSPALAPFVEWIAYYETASRNWRELILPTGTMALVVSMAEQTVPCRGGDAGATIHASNPAVLLGTSAGPVLADGAESHATALVSFQPGGSYPFFQAPGPAIDEPAVELEALWGRDGAVLRERLLEAGSAEAVLSTLEAALLARVVRPLAADPAVVAGAAMLGRGTAVAEVADRLGLTYWTFRRRFSQQAGLSPKRFARLRRLQRLLASVPAGREVDWARAAVEYRYFDQAHLINEFRALTGLTPGAYRPQPGCRNHHLPSRLPDSSNPRQHPRCDRTG